MIFKDGVVLSEIDPEDIEWMRNQRNDPSMRRYFREWKDISKEKQKEWYSEKGNNLNPNHVYFKIEHNPTMGSAYTGGTLVGCCGLHYVDWRLRSAEFGVFLSKESRGKGIGKKALELLFDFGFKEMNLHKIWAEVYDNNSSIELYRKLGFVDEGVLRDNYFCEGKYGNSIIMSVLENEWRSKYGDKPLWEIIL